MVGDVSLRSTMPVCPTSLCLAHIGCNKIFLDLPVHTSCLAEEAVQKIPGNPLCLMAHRERRFGRSGLNDASDWSAQSHEADAGWTRLPQDR